MSTRYEVVRPNGTSEGVIATEWDLHPSGALVFRSRDGAFIEFVIAYAKHQWVCFFEDGAS